MLLVPYWPPVSIKGSKLAGGSISGYFVQRSLSPVGTFEHRLLNPSCQ